MENGKSRFLSALNKKIEKLQSGNISPGKVGLLCKIKLLKDA